MITVIPGNRTAEYPEIFDAVHALRHRVFVDEMEWTDLASPDGRETDQFDDEHTVHLVSMQEGEVAGYIRVLPSERPHLLTDVLPDLQEVEYESGPDTWEASRYCVSPRWREGRRAFGSVGGELIAGLVEWSLASDVKHLIFEFEVNWILRALQLQFLVQPLGRLHQIGKQSVVAARLSITSTTLPAIRDKREHHQPVIRGLEPIRLAS